MIEIIRTGGRFRLRYLNTTELDEKRSSPEHVSVQSHSQNYNVIAGRYFDQLPDDEGFWKLELLKDVLASGILALSASESVVEQCVALSDGKNGVVVPDAGVSPRSVLIALQQRGEAVDGLWAITLRVRLKYLAASCVALFAWLRTTARTAIEPREPLLSDGAFVAIYGEYWNRSRHIVDRLADCPDPLNVLVVGRPTTWLPQLKALLREKAGRETIRIARVFDTSSAIRAIPAAFRRIVRGAGVIEKSMHEPSFRSLSAMIYRVIQGTASQIWWRRQGLAPNVAVFGLTGVADVSMLEREMQNSGVRTVHWVHGNSSGRIFYAWSDIALLKSRHEAQLHARLGGYRWCCSPTRPIPELAGGRGGCLLLTNLAHPMNPRFQRDGAKDEFSTVRMVAEALRSSGVGERLSWKPHPTMDLLAPKIKEQAMALARELDVDFIEPRGSIPRPLGDYNAVISTPSTIVIDCLNAGAPAIVFAQDDVEEDSIFNKFPLFANTLEALTEAVVALRDPRERERQFKRCWEHVGPTDDLTLARVFEIAEAPQLYAASVETEAAGEART